MGWDLRLCRHRAANGLHERRHDAQLGQLHVQQAAQRMHLIAGSDVPLPLGPELLAVLGSPILRLGELVLKHVHKPPKGGDLTAVRCRGEHLSWLSVRLNG